MNRLPPALRYYLAFVWIAGLMAWCTGWLLKFDQRAPSWPLLAVLCALLIATQSLPQHVFRGVKLSPDTAPLFMIVLCLPVSAAVSVTLIGASFAQILRRRPWYEAGFNVASSALGVFVGGTIYAGLAGPGGWWGAATGALLGAAALYLINSSLVAGAVSTQHRLPYGPIWQKVAGSDPLDHILMFLVGGLLALPWAWKPAIAGLLLAGVVVRVIQQRQKMHMPGTSQVPGM
ncbi:MAG: hypothetical protein ACP5UQ_02540 [Anaerolineae bacterium]